ncbi:MAG: DUF6049 family protein [Propionibacteriaceae bacterium]|jgi:hypothetical protein|nr:DUF6049 family protein [Propionibacteriaceae bacterium]
MAQAAPQYEATVELASVVTDDVGVRLTGAITSTGTDSLFRVQVVLWSDTQAITTTAEVDAAMSQDLTAEVGERLDTDDATTVVVSGRESFEPGQKAGFSVMATWDELGLTDKGVYFVGVDVRASATQWGEPVTIGHGSTVVTVVGDTVAPTVTVAMFTSQPSLIHDAVFTDDHLAGELTGRLAALLVLAGKPNMSWVIDPALYHEISVMAQGYEVMDGESTVPGKGAAAAKQWLAEFEELNAINGYRLPWGNPDLALGMETGSVQLIADAQAGDQAHPDLSGLPVLLWSANGPINDAWLTYVAPLRARVVLADVTSAATVTGGVVLACAKTPFPNGPGPTDGGTPVQRVQRALADDLINQSPLVRVVQSQAEIDLANQTIRSWTRPQSLGSINPSVAWQSSMSVGDPVPVLTATTIGTVTRLRATAEAYSSLTGDDTAGDSLALVPLSAGVSQSWADDASAEGYVLSADHWLRGLFNAVTMSATPEVSLTAKTSTFPVTVTNTMAVAVHVRLVARTTPDPMSLGNVAIPATDVITIEPGDKMPLVLSPTILREGEASLVLQLTTPDGVPIATPVTVAVHAQESAWMGWVVVGGAFILFIAGTFLRVRTMRAKKVSP